MKASPEGIRNEMWKSKKESHQHSNSFVHLHLRHETRIAAETAVEGQHSAPIACSTKRKWWTEVCDGLKKFGLDESGKGGGSPLTM